MGRHIDFTDFLVSPLKNPVHGLKGESWNLYLNFFNLNLLFGFKVIMHGLKERKGKKERKLVIDLRESRRKGK